MLEPASIDSPTSTSTLWSYSKQWARRSHDPRRTEAAKLLHRRRDDARHRPRRQHRDVCLDGGSLFGRTASRIVSGSAPVRARRRAGHRRRDWKSDRRRARGHQPASSAAGPRGTLFVPAAAAPASSSTQNHDWRGRPLRVPPAVQRRLHHHGGQARISRGSVRPPAAGRRVANTGPGRRPEGRRCPDLLVQARRDLGHGPRRSGRACRRHSDPRPASHDGLGAPAIRLCRAAGMDRRSRRLSHPRAAARRLLRRGRGDAGFRCGLDSAGRARARRANRLHCGNRRGDRIWGAHVDRGRRTPF